MGNVEASVVERFLVNGSTMTTPDLPAAVADFFETIAVRSWETDFPQGFTITGSAGHCVPCQPVTYPTCNDCG